MSIGGGLIVCVDKQRYIFLYITTTRFRVETQDGAISHFGLWHAQEFAVIFERLNVALVGVLRHILYAKGKLGDSTPVTVARMSGIVATFMGRCIVDTLEGQTTFHHLAKAVHGGRLLEMFFISLVAIGGRNDCKRNKPESVQGTCRVGGLLWLS